ncbi:hypothetical protein ACFL1Z_01905 [Thermodesulfobacteriota bacterium]
MFDENLIGEILQQVYEATKNRNKGQALYLLKHVYPIPIANYLQII